MGLEHQKIENKIKPDLKAKPDEEDSDFNGLDDLDELAHDLEEQDYLNENKTVK